MREIRPDLEPGVLRLASGATLVLERHQSRVLRRNPLGDPHVPSAVYLPPGYASNAALPVVYCLAGFTGTGRMLLNTMPWVEGVDERLDRLIASGQVRPLIAVLPDCFTRYGGSQYVNSSATGRYEDYLVAEIVPHIDRTYRTLARPGSRAVMGKSSGGYGACVLAMRHPDLFGLMACHSGDMYFEYCYGVDLPKLANGLWKHGGLDGFLAAFDAMPRKKEDALAVLNLVAMAACYSPDEREPLGIALPVDRDRDGPASVAALARPIGAARRRHAEALPPPAPLPRLRDEGRVPPPHRRPPLRPAPQGAPDPACAPGVRRRPHADHLSLRRVAAAHLGGVRGRLSSGGREATRSRSAPGSRCPPW
jgi:enterochelin esterase family protein